MGWRRAALLACCAASAVLAPACSPGGSALDDTGPGVEAFHRAYNAGDIRGIYRGSAPVFREMTPESTFVGFLEKARTRLGPAVDARFVESTRMSGRDGARSTSRYRTRFEAATATEVFVFVEVAGEPRLAGYTLDAPVNLQ